MVTVDTSTLGLGTYEDSIMFDGFSHLDGFDDIALGSINLRFAIAVVDDVTDVPEPGTFMLMLLGVLGLGYSRRPKKAA